MKTVIYGIPGSGKTEMLLRLIRGEEAANITFLTFSRAAAANARSRRIDEPRDLFGWRTVHSLVSRFLGLTKEQYWTQSDIEMFMEVNHINYKQTDTFFDEQTDGQRFLSLVDYLKHTKQKPIEEFSFNELYQEVSNYVSAFGGFSGFNLRSIGNIVDLIYKYEEAKKEQGKLDYSDILLQYKNDPYNSLSTKILVVDEFQDLSPLIYSIVKVWEKEAETVYYAGDAFQAIYTFMGAAPHFLLDEIKIADRPIYLTKTYRVGQAVFDFSKNIINRNSPEKLNLQAECENKGQVKRILSNSVFDVFKKEQGKIFLLTRTNWQKRQWETEFQKRGIEFSEFVQNKIWTADRINLSNALIAIKKGEPLKFEWLLSLIKHTPSKPFLQQGIKQKINKIFDADKPIPLSVLPGTVFAPNHSPYELLNNLMLLKLNEFEVDLFKRKIFSNPNFIDALPRITIGTMHASKGLEADAVILDLNYSSNIQRSLYNLDRKAEEARILYVAATRSRGNLYLTGQNMLVNPTYIQEVAYI